MEMKFYNELDVFDAKFIVYVTDSLSSFITKYPTFKDMGHASAFTYSFAGESGVKNFGVVLTTDNTDEHLTHEAVHLASDILRYMGVPHTSDTEEVYAYTISTVKKRLGTAIEKFKIKKEKNEGKRS